MSNEKHTFESAFHRLEEILETLNSDAASLDESLTLYEEADNLIRFCSKKLSDAETKVEMLMKSRDGDLLTHPDKKPLTQDF